MREFQANKSAFVEIPASQWEAFFLNWAFETRVAPLDAAPGDPVRVEDVDFIAWLPNHAVIGREKDNGRYFCAVYDDMIDGDRLPGDPDAFCCIVGLARPLFLAAIPERLRRQVTALLDAVEVAACTSTG